MIEDKSFFYYGWIYHKLLDPHQAEARERIVNLIPEDSSVLDIASGTGQLCFALRAQKHCRVIGIDLSLRMLQFAEKSKYYEDVTFLHQDATDLARFGDRTFDYASMLIFMHELPRERQVLILSEALRVADKAIIVDARAPLPKNPSGLGVRLVEATFGRDHRSHFCSFLVNGGIMGLLKIPDFQITVLHRSVFWRNCRELVMVTRSQ
jgi:ubiquinone/menaquinone biosynthesis C-methylase UbiE